MGSPRNWGTSGTIDPAAPSSKSGRSGHAHRREGLDSGRSPLVASNLFISSTPKLCRTVPPPQDWPQGRCSHYHNPSRRGAAAGGASGRPRTAGRRARPTSYALGLTSRRRPTAPPGRSRRRRGRTAPAAAAAAHCARCAARRSRRRRRGPRGAGAWPPRGGEGGAQPSALCRTAPLLRRRAAPLPLLRRIAARRRRRMPLGGRACPAPVATRSFRGAGRRRRRRRRASADHRDRRRRPRRAAS